MHCRCLDIEEGVLGMYLLLEIGIACYFLQTAIELGTER